MININILEDEDLQEVCKKFISSILPHNNYKGEFFATNLKTLFKYIWLDEFTMEYRVLLSALSKLNQIRCGVEGYVPRLTRTTFESVLNLSIPELVTDPKIGMANWLKYEGLNNNFQITSVKEDSCQKLFSRSMELYDECFSLEEDSASIINFLPNLEASFLNHVSRSTIEAQVKILNDSLSVGRKVYSGLNDWLLYTNSVGAEINSRLEEDKDGGLLVLDDIEKANSLLDEVATAFIPIAKYGIPQMDNFTPILRHRLVVVVGMANVGKSIFVYQQSANVLRAGGSVLYMCGETSKGKVLAGIMINLIYDKYGYMLRPEHIGNRYQCDEEVQKAIGMTLVDIIDSGKLKLQESFNYGTVYEELKQSYELSKFDLCVIDHSLSLGGNYGDGSAKAKVDKLAADSMKFRKDYPVCVMITSHPSTTSNKEIGGGKSSVSFPTKASQDLTANADELFILRETPELKKQGYIAFENYKRRDAPLVIEPILLEKMAEVCTFIYKPENQAMKSEISIDAATALKELENDYQYEDDDILYTIN